MSQEIRHAGAIFMGRYTPEAIGDYCAGPNHVLPTSGTARFSSPLGVYDFQKRSSLIMCSKRVLKRKTADLLAQQENLDAHARSARYRYAKYASAIINIPLSKYIDKGLIKSPLFESMRVEI
jgi:histidinol dehydrogenase